MPPESRVAATEAYGLKILGSYIGSDEFIQHSLLQHVAELEELGKKLSSYPELQGRMLLFRHCFLPKPQYLYRTIPPNLSHALYGPFEEIKRKVLAKILGLPRREDLKEATYRQAQLDIDKGGLGLKNESQIARAAYCASVMSMLKSQISPMSEILLEPHVTAALAPRADLPSNLRDFVVHLQGVYSDITPNLPDVIREASKLKFDKVLGTVQHQLYVMITSSTVDNFRASITHTSENAYLAWHTSLMCKEAGAWLLATPKMKAFQLTSREFRTSLLLRLFMEQPTLPHGVRCNCTGNPLIDKRCHHMLTGCGFGGCRIRAHDNQVAELNSCLAYLGMRTRKEQRGIFREFNPHDNHIPDITVINPPAHPTCSPSPLLLDVAIATVIEGLQNGDSYKYMPLATAETECRAANKSAAKKKKKYDPLCNPEEGRPKRFSFIPIIYETTGRMHPDTLAFIKLCCKSSSLHKKIEGETIYTFILKRLSVCFQKSMATNIFERTYAVTIPPSTYNRDHSFDTEYVFSEQSM
jgi:hypothetical protein